MEIQASHLAKHERYSTLVYPRHFRFLLKAASGSCEGVFRSTSICDSKPFSFALTHIILAIADSMAPTSHLRGRGFHPGHQPPEYRYNNLYSFIRAVREIRYSLNELQKQLPPRHICPFPSELSGEYDAYQQHYPL